MPPGISQFEDLVANILGGVVVGDSLHKPTEQSRGILQCQNDVSNRTE